MQAAARDDIHPGRINERRRAASRGEAELAADEVAAAVPPYAEDVLPRSCGTAAGLVRKCCETRPSTRRVSRAGAGTVLTSAPEGAHTMGVPAPCSLRSSEKVTPSCGGSAALQVE